jgi:hypothetical protein
MQEARYWLLERDGLHAIEEIRVTELYRAAASGNLTCLDQGRVHLLPIR